MKSDPRLKQFTGAVGGGELLRFSTLRMNRSSTVSNKNNKIKIRIGSRPVVREAGKHKKVVLHILTLS